MSERRLSAISISVAILLALCVPLVAQDMTLFSQTASAALDHQFGGRRLSWFLMDASGRVLAQQWKDAQRPIAPGSLVKPFVALAYGEQHNFVYPHVRCMGTRGHCWLPKGHGSLGLEQAIAQSCNAYFLFLANDLERNRAIATFARFGLNAPPHDAVDDTLIGLGDGWRETPLAIARAYLALVQDSPPPARERIVAGMQASAQVGTARDVDRALGAAAALAKTGTASCSHHPRAAADGFAIILYPAAQPRVVMLVRMHGATGAQTSAEAGAMLRAIGMGTR